MKQSTKPSTKPKQFNLETANEMFKFAFRVKKEHFAQQYKGLSEIELQQKTAAFFRLLDEKKR